MRRPTPLPANPANSSTPAKRLGTEAASAPPPPPLRRPAMAAAEAEDDRGAAADTSAPGVDATATGAVGGTAAPAATGTDTTAPAATATDTTAPAKGATNAHGRGIAGAEPAAPAPTVDGAGAPTRIRDVWRAARARRRVLRSEVRRFTVRARRRRIGWIVAGASTIALVATTLVIAYGPFFAVEHIQIEGAVRLDAATLEEAVGAQMGRPLPLVDESEIKAALVQFPMVESYQVEARPPHELLVRIVERTPIGVLEGPAGFSLVDAAGVVLETTPHAPAGAPQLRIAGGVDTPAFESAALVMRALPEIIRHQVTGVTASTRDDVTLLLGGANASVVWGSVDDSALKALVLETAMMQMPPGGVVSYDVSSPDAIVIR